MNRLAITLGLLLQFTSLSSLAQQVISCGTLFDNSSNASSSFVSNIPPGQSGNRVYHYYGDTYGLPDGVKIYFDNVPIREIWVGGTSYCTANGDGTTLATCRTGPVFWTNTNQILGPGDISTIPNNLLDTHFLNSGLTTSWPYNWGKTALHLEIVVPPSVCQVSIQSVTNNNSAGSIWQGILHCPTLDCPNTLPIQSAAAPSACSVDLNVGSCSEFLQNSVTWTGPNGFTATGAEQSVSAPGNYMASIHYSNQCTVNATTNLPSSLFGFNLQTNSTPVTCPGGSDGTASATVNGGTPPFQYQWSNQATTSSINNLSAGPYSVTATDSRGCSSVQNATVHQPYPLAVNASTLGTLCEEGNSGAVIAEPSGGTAPYTISMNGSNAVPAPHQFNNLPMGNYTLEVTDQHGCTSSADAVLGNDPATLTATIEYENCAYVTRYTLTNSRGVVHTEAIVNQHQYSDIDKWVNFSYGGCDFSAQLKWKGLVPSNVADIWIPNAFTPDEGQYNNTFFPKSSDPILLKDFVVFDRWGVEAFHESNILLEEGYLGWDGRYKGNMSPDGVYTYVATFECDVKKVGHVTLLR